MPDHENVAATFIFTYALNKEPEGERFHAQVTNVQRHLSMIHLLASWQRHQSQDIRSDSGH